MKRLMIFIDGNNFESAVNKLYGTETRLNYEALSKWIASKRSGILIRFYYYTAIGKHDRQKEEATKKFIHYLNTKIPNCIAKTGFIKVLGTDSKGELITTEKGTDVKIAVDLVTMAYNNAYDEAILLSADTDYEAAIKAVRSFGKIITVGIVDQQKGGYIKDLCDDHFIIKQEDLDKVKR